SGAGTAEPRRAHLDDRSGLIKDARPASRQGSPGRGPAVEDRWTTVLAAPAAGIDPVDGGGRQGLAAGEALLQALPELDLGLAEAPAEIDFATAQDGGEIAEAVGALELDAQVGQLLAELGQLRLLGLQLGAAVGQLFGVDVGLASPLVATQDRREALLQVG